MVNDNQPYGRMGGHAPSASDWHKGKVPGFEQVHGAPQKGDVATDGKHVGIVSRPGRTGAGAKQALGRTWEELSTNRELHKGVEFGVKAAGEVGKDVGEQVGEGTGSTTSLSHAAPPADIPRGLTPP